MKGETLILIMNTMKRKYFSTFFNAYDCLQNIKKCANLPPHSLIIFFLFNEFKITSQSDFLQSKL